MPQVGADWVHPFPEPHQISAIISQWWQEEYAVNIYVDPESLSSLTACRLIALDKNPALRPIGVGEVVTRIIGKAVLQVLKMYSGQLVTYSYVQDKNVGARLQSMP